MSVQAFLHATVLVSNLEAAREFYETALGLKPGERQLSFPGEWYQIGPVQLHLIVSEQLIGDRVNAQKWGRNRHLAFAVENLVELQQRLVAMGYAVQASSSGRAAIFVSDPDGNLIELTQV